MFLVIGVHAVDVRDIDFRKINIWDIDFRKNEFGILALNVWRGWG